MEIADDKFFIEGITVYYYSSTAAFTSLAKIIEKCREKGLKKVSLNIRDEKSFEYFRFLDFEFDYKDSTIVHIFNIFYREEMPHDRIVRYSKEKEFVVYDLLHDKICKDVTLYDKYDGFHLSFFKQIAELLYQCPGLD